MRRRDFLGVVAGAAAAWPLAATAQQAATPEIGFLHAGSFDGFANQVVAFRQGLNEAGFIPGQNVTIEYRWAAGHYDRLPALAAELVSRQVTVLVAGGGLNSVHAAKAATTTIPIVFITGADPVLVGLVTSLNRPEGNITGVSFSGRASQPKRLELIRELLPRATAIAVLSNPRNLLNPGDLADLKAAAVALKQQLHFLTAGTVAEIDQAFVQLGQQRPDALLLTGDPFFNTQRDLLSRCPHATVFQLFTTRKNSREREGWPATAPARPRLCAKPEITPDES